MSWTINGPREAEVAALGNDRQVESVCQPRTDDINTEPWLNPQFAILEAQLADVPPCPPVAIWITLQGRVVLVIYTAAAR